MKTPTEVLRQIRGRIRSEWRTAFWAAFVTGFFVHMPALLSDIPNHDGLASMHFDQNMITSGRWFLSAACGFSSYYTLPWLIGLIALFWLGTASAMLTEFLEIKDKCCIVLTGALFVTFPSVASTFAYVFTMDGYMLALTLSVASALCVKKRRLGFLPGAVCLAFGLGIYQAYLPFAAILSVYGILTSSMDGSGKASARKKAGFLLSVPCRYLYMGVLGAGLYYVILQVLLRIQGKELASYQGISGMGAGNGIPGSSASALELLGTMYRDFGAFTLKGNVLINNGFSLAAVLLLGASAAAVLVRFAARGWGKKAGFFAALVFAVLALPVASNLILAVSPGVTYHLLMRYQWVMFPILAVALAERYGRGKKPWALWCVCISGAVLAANFAVTDNIAYSNLEKRYEKTYAYCLRLLDRIEQTEGYYQGIPVAMIGVVGDESFPSTDITGDVTGNMIGMSGDVLLYTGENYESFLRNYLGATLNILPTEAMEEIYYSEEYRGMGSFPAPDSVKLVDGVIYVKTENRGEAYGGTDGEPVSLQEGGKQY